MVESYNSNYGQLFNESALQIRLNTQSIIEDIELFLMGKKWITSKNEEGETIASMVPICPNATPRANPQGVQSILSFLRCQLNPQVVQGNFDNASLSQFIFELHMAINKDFMVNLNRWGIAEEDYEFMINTIISMLWAFLTRTKDNKERESYAATVRHFETSNIQETQKKGLFGGGAG